jgi:sulfate adenylyltransferase (ADP) / ATP adenylyltransferase
VIDLPTVAKATAQARASGALEPVLTESAVIDDAGARFVVRIASTLTAKSAAPPRADPLGDYEPDLYVGDVDSTHYALLNKYPVMADHLLVVTRRFASQEELLDASDFAALAALLGQLDWLAFYNGGRIAGASQARKHLQFVPLPLAAEVETPVPLEPRYGALPFQHAYAPLSSIAEMEATYRQLAARWPGAPYNLLATRRWMLVVPRSLECYGTISINALGFAGSLFVRTRAELELVRRAGPMKVLAAVTLE